MKIFKEQWAGMGLSLDLGLVKGDMELAGAIWRNLLGARGAQGIAYPNTSSSSTSTSTPHFRRSVNLVGGEVINVSKVDFEKEEAKDDGSGVHDFAPEEADKYLTYPEVMLDVVDYLRREIARLDKVSDETIMNGDWTKLSFGRVK
jgi:cytochrome b pre-mRNA-processing protein 3